LPKGPRGEKRPADVVANAVKVARLATGEETEELHKPNGRTRQPFKAGYSDTEFSRAGHLAGSLIENLAAAPGEAIKRRLDCLQVLFSSGCGSV